MALALLEGVGLVLYRQATGRGPGWAMAPNLAAGGTLLLALRLALGGAWWGWLGVSLAAAGLAHGVDLWLRWPRPRP